MSSTKSKKIITTLLCAVLCISTLVSCGKKGASGPINSQSSEDGTVAEDVAGAEDNGTDAGEQGETEEDTYLGETVEQTALYSLEGLGTIDLSLQNHSPNQKAAGMVWESTPFWKYEGVDDNGEITSSMAIRTSKAQLYDVSSGKVLDFVIYSDQNSGEIYKIVYIEKTDSGYILVDFYYNNGKPNFVFRRGDSVFTPTYATTEKIGERYFYNDDVMVRWRLINVPEYIDEWTLTVDPTMYWHYNQYDYYNGMTSDETANYDAIEFNILNFAYNVYERIAEKGYIGSVGGKVTDSSGNAMSGVSVRIYRQSDGVLLYETTTDSDGDYSVYTYMDGTDCFVYFSYDEGYKAVKAYELNLSDSMVSYDYGEVTLFRNDEPDTEVSFSVFDAAAHDTSGESVNAGLAGADITIRNGINAKDGDAVATAKADDSGVVNCRLDAGVYTAEVSKDGYETLYITIEVNGSISVSVPDCYLVPTIPTGSCAILLTWSGDEDLDLTVFTPHQSTGGDMAHIGGNSLSDSYGNYIVRDNAGGCELAYIDSSAAGAYTIYVGDYSQITAGNYYTDILNSLNIHIYIIYEDGHIEEYKLGSGSVGTVWEVAEIRGGESVSSGRTYYDLSGKTWWTEQKLSNVTGEGMIVTFGSYEQDNNPSNGKEPIEWVVLDVQDGKALLLSRYILDSVQYNDEDRREEWDYGVNYDCWENCSLRSWCNNTFYNVAFTEQEKGQIAESRLSGKGNIYDVDDHVTSDKIFCLSTDEVRKYFNLNEWSDEWGWSYSSSQELLGEPTKYAENLLYTIDIDSDIYNQGIYDEIDGWSTSCRDMGYTSDCIGMTTAYWWLRTYEAYCGEFVDEFGNVCKMEDRTSFSSEAHCGVRPALWVNL